MGRPLNLRVTLLGSYQKQMFLGHLIPGLPSVKIQSNRKGLAGGFLGGTIWETH